MSTSLKYPHIEKIEGEPARLERLPRIRVALIVMDYLEHGWSVEEMCRQHPHLTLAEAHAAMAYYFDHEAELEREIREEINQVEREQSNAQRSPIYYRLRAQSQF
jgi:Protein of unknown function (DUF433)